MGKRLILIILAILILCTPVSAFWVDEEWLDDPRPRKIVKVCARIPHDTLKINKIWIDNNLYMIFVDYNGDGVTDQVHTHIKVFETKESMWWYCDGDSTVEKAMKYITKWFKLHSC